MSYKPTDFFLGVMEFFAILMPGAILTFLLLDYGTALFGVLLPSLPGASAKWVAFGVASYILGHLLHHVGGIFLDEWIYDKLYVKKYKRRKGKERLLTKTRELMKEKLGDDAQMTGAFSWAGSFVRAHNASASGETERLGADSKFFRSLSLVALAGMVLFAAEKSGLASGGALLLFVFSLWRFCDRRWKNTKLTYEYFIMLTLEDADRRS